MQQILRLNNYNPIWIAILIGLLLSLINILTDDLINSDGMLYSEVAVKFFSGDWQGAMAQFSWPFYPLLVGAISKISFLDFEITAQLINTALLALLVYMFIRCSQLMGGDKLVTIFAAILILTNVALNDYRDLVIRDHGYWAMFFTALFFFLQYYQTKALKYAFGFGLSILIATLFRIEGIVFAFLAPLILLFQNISWRERLYQTALPFLPLIAAGSVALIIVISTPALFGKILTIAHTDDGILQGPLNYFQTSFQGVFQQIVEKGDLIEAHVFDLNAKNMGTKSMIAILIMMFVVKVISAAGYISVFFAMLTGFSSRLRHTISNLNVISGFMLINVLVLAVVVSSKTFLTPRYAMTLGLLITLPAAFSLADFFRTKIPSYPVLQKRLKVLLIVVLSYMFLDGLISTGASKSYLRESGVWLKNNVPIEARVFSNDGALYYYSGRNLDQNIIQFSYGYTRFSRLPPIAEALLYDYVAFKVKRKQKGFDEKVILWAGSEPIYSANNERGDKVIIFKLR